LKSSFTTAIAISFGLVVLLGYFFSVDGNGNATMLGILRNFLLQGAIILSAIALLVGIANLVAVHVRKIQTGSSRGYSMILILSFIITLGIGFYDISNTYLFQEPNFQQTIWIFKNIQLPIEISLMAVLVVSLSYAAARLFTRRLTSLSIVFVSIVITLLISAAPQLTSLAPTLSKLHSWILRVPAMAGARGILLGVALGTIATGIRILTGNDRPARRALNP
jgi:cytochrome bd-type quinol oxidase subunit 2